VGSGAQAGLHTGGTARPGARNARLCHSGWNGPRPRHAPSQAVAIVRLPRAAERLLLREDTSNNQQRDEPRNFAITEEALHTGNDGRDGRGPRRRRERHRRSENECPQSRFRQGPVSRSPSEAVTGQAVYIFSVRRVEEKKDNVSRPGMLDDGWHAAPRWLRRLEAETGSREGCDGKWFILPISVAWCARYCGVPGILRRCCCR